MKICPICKKQYGSSVNICPQDNEILEEDLAALVGQTLDNQYLIEKLLGQGGMGAVFRARHTLLGDQVAIKIMPSGISRNADYQRRFLREGKTARQFSHPNVVTVHDLRTTQDGMLYMVLEYVEGHTLNEELKNRRKFSPKEAVDILSPIGEALTMAHSLGIVHRDLKPDNIMIGKGKDGSKVVKLLDLGIAKVNNANATALTITGQILGTPHYMSPEQWNADDIDGRADIYSLGIILYELVAGVKPFSGKTVQKLAYEHAVSTPSLLSNVVSRVSEEFSKVVNKSLEKEPDKRQQNCQELFQELRESLKYEIVPNDELEQCKTLVSSDSGDTLGISQNKTQQENQATLVSKTGISNLETKATSENEKTLANSSTLVGNVETTNPGKNTFNQMQKADNTLISEEPLANEKGQMPNKLFNDATSSKLRVNSQNTSNEVTENHLEKFANSEKEIIKKEITKSFFQEDKNNIETNQINNQIDLTGKKSVLVPVAIVSLVLAVLLSGAVYFLRTNDSTVNLPSPTPSVSISDSQESNEILNYWLEFTPYKKTEGEVPIKSANVKLVSSKNYLKFHFVAKDSGYLYILGLGKNNSLVTFLSNNPTEEDTGLKSNKIIVGEKITFPSGVNAYGGERILDLGGKAGKEDYTVVFSLKPITNLVSLNSKPGYELTPKDVAEFEEFRKNAKVAQVVFEEGKDVSSIAKILSSSAKEDQATIFNIIFEHN